MSDDSTRSVAAIVDRHSVVVFFTLAYTFSWASYILASGARYFPLGPFVAAFIVSWVAGGLVGLGKWVRGTLHWRISPRWYLLALVLPVSLGSIAVTSNLLLGASCHSIVAMDSLASYLVIFPMALVDAPFWEEASWRGYALPRFRASRSRIANTLLLAVLLTGWHLPLAVALGTVAVPYLIGAFASAIVTNWVYYRSGGCALIAVIFHTTQNSVSGFMIFKMFSGADLQQLWWLYAATYAGAALLGLRAIGLLLPTDRHPAIDSHSYSED